MVDYEELEDRELIHRIAQLDKGALEALYGRYATPVYSLAMFMLRHEALAEEVDPGNLSSTFGSKPPASKLTGASRAPGS